MKITIDVLENESNKDNLEYLISDTSNEAITVLMFANFLAKLDREQAMSNF